MQPIELVEVAALLAVHGRRCLSGGGYASEASAGAYWLAARRRLDGWRRALPDPGQPRSAAALGEGLRAVVEEIFISELLARVGTALAEGCEVQQPTGCLAPIFRSVLRGHHEARNLALRVLVDRAGGDAPQLAALNQVRRRCEKWTDMLLSRLAPDCPVEALAFEPDRVRDFARDLREEAGEELPAEADWLLLQAGIRASFASGLSPLAVSDGSRRVAAALVACFPADAFAATGPLRDLGAARIGYALDDLESWVAGLLEDESGAGVRQFA